MRTISKESFVEIGSRHAWWVAWHENQWWWISIATIIGPDATTDFAAGKMICRYGKASWVVVGSVWYQHVCQMLAIVCASFCGSNLASSSTSKHSHLHAAKQWSPDRGSEMTYAKILCISKYIFIFKYIQDEFESISSRLSWAPHLGALISAETEMKKRIIIDEVRWWSPILFIVKQKTLARCDIEQP